MLYVHYCQSFPAISPTDLRLNKKQYVKWAFHENTNGVWIVLIKKIWLSICYPYSMEYQTGPLIIVWAKQQFKRMNQHPVLRWTLYLSWYENYNILYTISLCLSQRRFRFHSDWLNESKIFDHMISCQCNYCGLSKLPTDHVIAYFSFRQ